MKPSLLFRQYIWIVNTLRREKRLTLEELNEMWMADEVVDGNSLPRTTFNRHRDAILDMFGVIIDCDAKDGYRYFIYNPEVSTYGPCRHPSLWQNAQLPAHPSAPPFPA